MCNIVPNAGGGQPGFPGAWVSLAAPRMSLALYGGTWGWSSAHPAGFYPLLWAGCPFQLCFGQKSSFKLTFILQHHSPGKRRLSCAVSGVEFEKSHSVASLSSVRYSHSTVHHHPGSLSRIGSRLGYLLPIPDKARSDHCLISCKLMKQTH